MCNNRAGWSRGGGWKGARSARPLRAGRKSRSPKRGTAQPGPGCSLQQAPVLWGEERAPRRMGSCRQPFQPGSTSAPSTEAVPSSAASAATAPRDGALPVLSTTSFNPTVQPGDPALVLVRTVSTPVPAEGTSVPRDPQCDREQILPRTPQRPAASCTILPAGATAPGRNLLPGTDRIAPKPGGCRGRQHKVAPLKGASGLTPSPQACSCELPAQPGPAPSSARPQPATGSLAKLILRAEAGGRHLLPVGGSSLQSRSKIWSLSRGSGCKNLHSSWARAQLYPGTAAHAGSSLRAWLRGEQRSAGSRYRFQPRETPAGVNRLCRAVGSPGTSGDEATPGLRLPLSLESRAGFPRGRESMRPMVFGSQPTPGTAWSWQCGHQHRPAPAVPQLPTDPSRFAKGIYLPVTCATPPRWLLHPVARRVLSRALHQCTGALCKGWDHHPPFQVSRERCGENSSPVPPRQLQQPLHPASSSRCSHGSGSARARNAAALQHAALLCMSPARRRAESGPGETHPSAVRGLGETEARMEMSFQTSWKSSDTQTRARWALVR